MKYKVGDKVRIKDLETLPQVLRGRVMQIKRVYSNNYDMTELLCPVFWTDELIEGLVEDEMSLDKAGQITDFEYDGLSYTLPEGYIFKDENNNVINATKIVLEKKKKEYPKTYGECLKVLGYDDREVYCIFHTGADERLFEVLYNLKVCRDAYWKIAGEEMGLNRPWKPSWDKCTGEKYCISRVLNAIRHDAVSNSEYHNRILAFPTAEMRDLRSL